MVPRPRHACLAAATPGLSARLDTVVRRHRSRHGDRGDRSRAGGTGREANALRRTLAANLVLNTGWSVLFWRSRRPWLSAIWCALLTAQSAHLARTVGEVDPALRRALAAYPAWCGFATALNVSIALRNS